MEDVDFAKAWLRFKAYIGQERGHGQDDLLAEMSRIEVECSETHADAEMARNGRSQQKRTRSTSKDGPPSDRAAKAARTDAPDTADPLLQEEQGHERDHRHRDREPAGV